MFTFQSTQFNLKGFLMVLMAAFLGGIRWTFTQVLMQKAELGQCWVSVTGGSEGWRIVKEDKMVNLVH